MPDFKTASHVEHLREDHSHGIELHGAGQDPPLENHGSPTDDSTRNGFGDSISSGIFSKEGKGNSMRQFLSAITPDSINQDRAQSRTWRTTWIRFGPLSGICAILLAIASLVASLGILAGSDSRPVANWSSPPSTYLAVFTAIANLSVRYAAIQGVVIAWWSRAYRGSTLAKLHWDWRAGTTVRGAVTAGRHMGLLGVIVIRNATELTKRFTAGPLIQRSSTVIPAPIVDHPVPLNTTMAAELPTGFSGYWAYDESYASDLVFNETIPTNKKRGVSRHIIAYPNNNLTGYVTQSWIDDTPLLRTVHGCPDKCKVKLTAPALFQTSCSSHTVELNPYQKWSHGFVQQQGLTAPPLSSDGYITSIVLVVSERYEWINLVTGFAKPKDCKGTLNYDICTLEAGIGEYDVTVHEDGSTTLDSAFPKLLALSNNTSVDQSTVSGTGIHPSTLGGIVYLHAQKFNSAFSWYPENGSIRTQEWGSVPFGLVAEPDVIPTICQSYKDPQERIMTSMNKLMVYSGAHAAAQWGQQLDSPVGFPINKTTTGQLHGSRAVFATDYWYFFGAAIVLLTCIALILPTYWGWWKLGRSVSFSPLEIAKAFESPLFAHIDSNSSGRDIAKAVGRVQVQYGATRTTGPGQGMKLAFANPEEVTAPRNGCRYDV